MASFQSASIDFELSPGILRAASLPFRFVLKRRFGFQKVIFSKGCSKCDSKTDHPERFQSTLKSISTPFKGLFLHTDYISLNSLARRASLKEPLSQKELRSSREERQSQCRLEDLGRKSVRLRGSHSQRVKGSNKRSECFIKIVRGAIKFACSKVSPRLSRAKG